MLAKAYGKFISSLASALPKLSDYIFFSGVENIA
jgi:hypothetical protein